MKMKMKMKMKFIYIHSNLISSFLFFLSVTQAISPTGTIERATKQQLLASLSPSTEKNRALSAASQPFITSPSGKYEGFLLRRATVPGAGGFGNDFCYIQIQESGHAVWESECAVVSNVNTCSLLFSDAGLEIFDGSRSTWDTDADGDALETLELVDSGDMRIRDRNGDLAWKASDNPIVNQQCGSVGSPGLIPAQPSFASNIGDGGLNFGQPISNQQKGPVVDQKQPLTGLNPPFGVSNLPLIEHTPFDSGSPASTEISSKFLLSLVSFLVVWVING